jgi:hypothetical protein
MQMANATSLASLPKRFGIHSLYLYGHRLNKYWQIHTLSACNVCTVQAVVPDKTHKSPRISNCIHSYQTRPAIAPHFTQLGESSTCTQQAHALVITTSEQQIQPQPCPSSASLSLIAPGLFMLDRLLAVSLAVPLASCIRAAFCPAKWRLKVHPQHRSAGEGLRT